MMVLLTIYGKSCFFFVGLLPVEQAASLTKSYNLVFNLGLLDANIDRIVAQCSNGIKADVEALLRTLAFEAP